ncbi:hypothetical protein ACP8HI_24660 [Paenibacillus sp. FA6]|uniref:hypothetical protein n=1 Tax=Paenibacillus sp. FA6 TaxID=3413029 RepID=UPI003F65550D
MKPKVFTRNRAVGMFFLLVIFIIGTCVVMGMSSQKSSDEVVFAIDTYEVTDSEFNAFLQNKKALTASYFKRTYDIDYSEDFWTSSFNGENPLEYAKQQVMDDLLKVKIEQIMMKENGVVSDISYKSFLKSLESENNERQRKLKNNEPIYGPKNYGAQEYYSYLHSINYQKLIDKLSKVASNTLSDDAVQQMYEDMKLDYFHKGYSFDYEKISLISESGGSKEALEEIQHISVSNDVSLEEAAKLIGQSVRVESMTLDLDEVSKDDTLSQLLYETFLELNDGEFSEVDQISSESFMYRISEKQDKGFEKFDDVKSAVIQIHVQGQLEQKVSQRLSEAKVQMNEEVFNKIAFT